MATTAYINLKPAQRRALAYQLLRDTSRGITISIHKCDPGMVETQLAAHDQFIHLNGDPSELPEIEPRRKRR